ncbi:MAG: tetratricopeptide repeat protein [Myxococcota bacterium]
MKLDRFDAAVALALVGLCFAIYAPSFDFGFVDFDDDRYVTEHRLVLGGLDFESAAKAFTRTKASNWHPLTWISHMADVSLFGLDAGAHHAMSAGLHALAGVVLFVVLRRMTGRCQDDRRALGLSALVAAFFIAHPTHVESVAWISERKDVLCALFWFAAMGAYLHYARAPSFARYTWVVVAFVAALLSKPMAVSLPFVLLLLDVWPLARFPGMAGPAPGRTPAQTTGALLLEKLPLGALAVASATVTLYAQNLGGALQTVERFPLFERALNAVISLDRYALLALWPTGLTIFHPRLDLSHWNALSLLAVCLPPVLWAAVAVHQRRRRPFLLVGLAWFAICLAPVLGVVQVGEQSIADRYTYLPYVGLSIALFWGLESIWPRHQHRSRVLLALALVAVAASGVAAREQLHTWRDSESLWTRALEVHPESALANLQVSQLLRERGDLAGARMHAERALESEPRMLLAHYQLAILHHTAGRADAARDSLARALAIDSRFAVGFAMRAEWARRAGNWAAAVADFERALAIDPRLQRKSAFSAARAAAILSRDRAWEPPKSRQSPPDAAREPASSPGRAPVGN